MLSGWQPTERAATERQIKRILLALGDVPASAVDQDAVNRLRDTLMRPRPNPASVRTQIITPLRAVLNFGFQNGWCDKPVFKLPKINPVETEFSLPAEAELIIAAAAPYLRPLLEFLYSTGARVGEALSLDWRWVDLAGAQVTFLASLTKAKKRRVAFLPPRAVAALASLPEPHLGPVFGWETNPTADGQVKRRRRVYKRRPGKGGEIKRAFDAAVRRAGISRRLTPHSTRHSWASWWYAIHRDIMALKAEGGWSTIGLVERYAHLVPRGQEAQIAAFWGLVWNEAWRPAPRPLPGGLSYPQAYPDTQWTPGAVRNHRTG
jgi:integrase